MSKCPMCETGTDDAGLARAAAQLGETPALAAAATNLTTTRWGPAEWRGWVWDHPSLDIPGLYATCLDPAPEADKT